MKTYSHSDLVYKGAAWCNSNKLYFVRNNGVCLSQKAFEAEMRRDYPTRMWETPEYKEAWKNHFRFYFHTILKEWRAAGVNESPDVFAIGNLCTLLLECKATRSDFLADKKKEFRQSTKGFGNYRMYVANHGIISPDELPDGWGLLLPKSSGLEIAVPPRAYFKKSEITDTVVFISLIQKANRIFAGCLDMKEEIICCNQYQYPEWNGSFGIYTCRQCGKTREVERRTRTVTLYSKVKS